MIKYQREKFGIKVEEEKGPVPQARPETEAKPVTETIQMQPVPMSSSNIKVEVPRRPSQHTMPQTDVQSNPSPAPKAQVSAPVLKPTPPIHATNAEQILDAQPNKFMYRPGEVVWYQRDTERGGALGLSVVVNRELSRDDRRVARAAYTVQPLCHPRSHPDVVRIADEQFLKPWLAFSPPDTFHLSLRSVNVTFEGIPWDKLLNGDYGPGDTEADASIFAARTVDGTYTPFEVVSKSVDETKYNGLFLGGEKIWRGEALRLKSSTKDILILSEIIEKTHTPGHLPDVYLIGDIYSYRPVPQSRPMPRNTYLPNRVQQDLEFRNNASLTHGRGANWWKIIPPGARLTLPQVKGRWYESRFMVPILHSPEKLAHEVTTGDVSDVGDSLNSHGDCSAKGAGSGVDRKEQRILAFGQSVPPTTAFIAGPVSQPQPHYAGAPMQQQPSQNQVQVQVQVPLQQQQQQRQYATSNSNSIQAQLQAAQRQRSPTIGKEDTEMANFVQGEEMDSGFTQAFIG